MRSLRLHLSYSNVISTACLFLLLGGGAWAATSARSTSIHACYSKRSGALRIAKHCGHREKALTWNKAGKTGKTGAQGVPGRDGATGPVGPSDVFADGTASATLSSSNVVYGKVTVPPGNYVLLGKAGFLATSAGDEATCTIGPDAAAATSWDGSLASAGAAKINSISLSAVQTFASTQDVYMLCRAVIGGGSIDDVHLIAIQTQSLHGSTPAD